MESLYGQIKEQVDKMQYTRQCLSNDIDTLNYKISILDKTAFSSEQECKRTEQRVQELTDKKDKLEKLIANILNMIMKAIPNSSRSSKKILKLYYPTTKYSYHYFLQR